MNCHHSSTGPRAGSPSIGCRVISVVSGFSLNEPFCSFDPENVICASAPIEGSFSVSLPRG